MTAHTERKVINQQSTREDLLYSKYVHPFGSVDHSIVVLVRLIAICHGEDCFPLKAEYFPNKFSTVMRDRVLY